VALLYAVWFAIQLQAWTGFRVSAGWGS